MESTMRIYTKTGDGGETSLFGGGRVAKDHPRVAAFGDVDELNAVLGVAIAADPGDLESDLLLGVQKQLMAIAAQLATPEPDKVKKALAKAQIDESTVVGIEAAMDRIDAELPELTSFVLPGGTGKSAALQWARAVCRRAERSVVELSKTEPVPPLIRAYLNRLSDLLFLAARLANHRMGKQDEEW